MEMIQQLKEELYQVAQRKLFLEQEMKTMDYYIRALKKELDQRMPKIQ